MALFGEYLGAMGVSSLIGHELIQIFSLTLFEKMPLQQAFSANHPSSDDIDIGNQLNLFAF